MALQGKSRIALLILGDVAVAGVAVIATLKGSFVIAAGAIIFLAITYFPLISIWRRRRAARREAE